MFAASVVSFGLRQVLGEGAEDVIACVKGHFCDPGQSLPKTLETANERAWKAFEVALGEKTIRSKIGKWFTSAADRAFCAQVEQFLQCETVSLCRPSEDFRRQCLDELLKARRGGELSTHCLDHDDLAEKTARCPFCAHPQDLVSTAWNVVGDLASKLHCQYPNLAKFIEQRPPSGPPLLVAAFSYFFRLEIQDNPELAQQLMVTGLQKLSADQEQNFCALQQALTHHGCQLETLTHKVTEDLNLIKETVLDIREELRMMREEVKACLGRVGMAPGVVRPQDSLSIRRETDRVAVRQLLQQFRQLPAGEQQQLPDLLRDLGKLQVGAGDFAGAWNTFQEAAENASASDDQAEAYFDAFRAALEQKRWDEACAAYRQASTRDPRRFSLFSRSRYELVKVLGAGGFGTVFLCKDPFFNEQAVVKALHPQFESNWEEIFSEARTLRLLSHPAIIGVRDCAYADPENKRRPYLVMEYFDGATLQAYIQEKGTLEPAELIPLALEIARGMDVVHQKGVLHRDLKPDNILVRREGERWQAKIIDFGLATEHEEEEAGAETASQGNGLTSDNVAGTVLYAPPEQLGQLPGVKPGPYSDLYSFGKMCLYVLFKTTAPHRRHWSSLSGELATMIERCTEEDPRERYASFAPVIEVLERLERGEAAAETATSAPPSGPVAAGKRKAGSRYTNTLNMELAWVPPGSFIMGSPAGEEGRKPEERQHEVTLTQGFWLGVTPVTQEQWQAVMDSNPSRFPGADHPVEQVSWGACQEFCRRLGEREGRQYRLPTEAEWEYACRAGSTTAFCNGNDAADLQRVGWCSEGQLGSAGRTRPVRSYQANAWGLHDMHGNVLEWCQDRHGPYRLMAQVDPQGALTGDRRVARGGSWGVFPRSCRSAFRSSGKPDKGSYYIGFRVVLCAEDALK